MLRMGRWRLYAAAMLIASGSTWSLEDYYSRIPTNAGPAPRKEGVPDSGWANRYYTGKRQVNELMVKKPIVAVPVGGAPAMTSIPPSTRRVPALAYENDNPEDASMDDLERTASRENPPSRGTDLPPGMEKGVADLEASLAELRVYSAAVAAHVQKNGLRGFLSVTPELKAEGRAVGQKLGGGVRGIVTDASNDITSESAQR